MSTDSKSAQSDAPDDGGAAEVHEATELTELLDQIDGAANEHQQTSVEDIIEAVGVRSFAPLLLFAGLVMLAPIIGDIPGVPVMMGLLVILVAGQLILRRDHIWLPRWLLKRSVSCSKVRKSVHWLRKPARFMDKWSRRRYVWVVRHAGAYVIAATCIVIAAATPIMEVIPFSANLAGTAITAFGLALIRQDGLIALIAVTCSVATTVVVAYQLF